MQPIADGGDMGGSLRNPASFCGVVGFRPTPGRVPSWPTELPWDTLTTAGPMARTVDDVALLLSVMAGPDPRVPISLEGPFAADLTGDVRGLRLAWSPTLGGLPVDPAVLDVLTPAVSLFADLGCFVDVDTPDLSEAEFVFRTLRAHQFAMAFDADLSAYKPSLAWNIREGLGLSASTIRRATQAWARVWRAGLDFFDRYDALLAPVSQVPPFPAEWEYPHEIAGVRMESYLDWMRSAYHVTMLGAPAVSVPAGLSASGLPIGLQIVTRPRSDLRALQLAKAFETARGRPGVPTLTWGNGASGDT
jgi:amidase